MTCSGNCRPLGYSHTSSAPPARLSSPQHASYSKRCACCSNALHACFTCPAPDLSLLQADSLWYAPDGSPSSADKLLIQRLEVEAQLTARQGRCASASCGGAAELPPLDLPAAAAAAGDGVGAVALSQVPPAFLCPISMQVRCVVGCVVSCVARGGMRHSRWLQRSAGHSSSAWSPKVAQQWTGTKV